MLVWLSWLIFDLQNEEPGVGDSSDERGEHVERVARRQAQRLKHEVTPTRAVQYCG